jgi:hypothetical protein
LSLTMIRLMAQGTTSILLLSHSFLILTCT